MRQDALSRHQLYSLVEEDFEGKLVIGADHKNPSTLEAEEVKRILEGAREVGGWQGAVSCFSVAMMTFLRLRPGEL